jgi:hypothetical protein
MKRLGFLSRTANGRPERRHFHLGNVKSLFKNNIPSITTITRLVVKRPFCLLANYPDLSIAIPK